MDNDIVIIGAGGVGREIASILKNDSRINFNLKGFIDDTIPTGTLINGKSVLGGIEWLKNNNKLAAVIAIGNPEVRKGIIEVLKSMDIFCPTIIHPNVSIHDMENVKIGQGCYIADGCIFTTNIVIEDYCFINTSCTLQHDTFIESNSVLMPGVRITGGAKIGSGTFVFPNCVIATASVIEKNSIIRNSIL
ncbi:putative acetyltransferase EpsM [compost metagenome]